MKISTKKQAIISDLWFRSELKQSDSNLVIKYTEQGEESYYTIGKYSFNDFTGVSHIEPLTGMAKMSFSDVFRRLSCDIISDDCNYPRLK